MVKIIPSTNVWDFFFFFFIFSHKKPIPELFPPLVGIVLGGQVPVQIPQNIVYIDTGDQTS